MKEGDDGTRPAAFNTEGDGATPSEVVELLRQIELNPQFDDDEYDGDYEEQHEEQEVEESNDEEEIAFTTGGHLTEGETAWGMMASFVTPALDLPIKLIHAETLANFLRKYPHGSEVILLGEGKAAFLAAAARICLDQVMNPTEGWKMPRESGDNGAVLVEVLVRVECALNRWEDLLVMLDRSKPVRDRGALVLACTEQLLLAFSSNLVRKTSTVISGVVGAFLGEVLDLAVEREPSLRKGVIGLFPFLQKPQYSELVPPLEGKLQAIVERRYLTAPWSSRLLICCVCLIATLPQFVQKVTTRYASDLEEISQDRYSILRMLEGWDTLLAMPSNVLHLIKLNVTVPLVTAILRSWERCAKVITQTQLPFSSTASFVGEILWSLTVLCLVDCQAHQLLLQFSGNFLNSRPTQEDVQPLRAAASLLLIPVALSNGTIPEKLVTSALLFACEPGSPQVLQSLFSVKQLMKCLTTAESVRDVLHATVHKCHDPVEHGRSKVFGPFYQMLNLCSKKVSGLPGFTSVAEDVLSVLQNEEFTLSKKRAYRDEENWYQVIRVTEDKAQVCIMGEHSAYISAINLTECILQTGTIISSLFLVAAMVPSLKRTPLGHRAKAFIFSSSGSSTKSLEKFIKSIQPESPDIEELEVQLLQKLPSSKRAAIKVQKKVPTHLLKYLYYCDCDPELNPKKSPFMKTMTSSLTESLDTLVSLHVSPELQEDEVLNLVLHSQADPHEIIVDEKQQVSLFEEVIKLNNVTLATQLLPFCNPHLPLHLLANAILHNSPQMVDLLWCHGMVIPEPVDIDRAFLSTFHRSLLIGSRECVELAHLKNPATWDPSRHNLFPWWFKQLVLATVILCWLRYSTALSQAGNKEEQHPIGTLPLPVVNHILSFLSPNHWLGPRRVRLS
ncbi:hypothetical protein Pelo_17679 [Pelomyxa schiedti]|nr:hypothetical protein Pelo_17679 [Pelomyxa schiedti]